MTDPTTRALSLLGLLDSRGSWTAADLAERLGVTSRTIRRDIDRLRALGYVIEADGGPGGGYLLGRGQVMPPLLLDEGQAVSVTLALMKAARHDSGIEAEAALRALSTIDAVIPASLRARLGALRESSLVPEQGGGVDATALLTCADGVRRQSRLTFTYRDRFGTLTERKVEPHRLVMRGGAWKLVAYDLGRDDWRTFRVDRLSDPEVGTWQFTPRAGAEDAVARLDEPVPPTAWRHPFTVHISAPLADVEQSMPRLAGRFRAVDDTHCEFTTGVDDPEEAACWLAWMPFDFHVSGDDAVKLALARLARRLHEAAG